MWDLFLRFLKTKELAVVESGMKLKGKKVEESRKLDTISKALKMLLIYSANCGPLNRNISKHRKLSKCQQFIYHSFLVCFVSLFFVS